MLLYRVECERGLGPYVGGGVDVRHPYWYFGPSCIVNDCGVLTPSGVIGAYQTTDDGQYTHVLAMENLKDLLTIFVTDMDSPEYIPVSVYEVDPSNTWVYFSYLGCSRQTLFDRTKATLVRREKIRSIQFTGHLHDVCPHHLTFDSNYLYSR